MSILIEGGAVLDVIEGGVSMRRADIRVVGDRIAAVEQRLDPLPGETVIAAGGRLVMPGLVNAHFHSPVNHMKGMLDSLPLEVFMLYESPSLAALLPTPREAYVRTMLAALEMLRSGVTAVQDDAFFVPHPTPEIVDAVFQAYEDVGIRARLALDQSDMPELGKLPFIDDLVTPAQKARLAAPPEFGAEALLAAYERMIATWHGRAGGRIKAAVSCSAPQRVSLDYFAALDDLSRRHDLPFYAHMLETKVQRVLGTEKLGGRSLVRYTADLGFLSERMNLIHGIWIDEADMDLIADAGTVVAHNPISNLRLGSGIMPFRALRERGIPICLGTDEAIADDAVNMWAVAKTAALLHTLTDPDYAVWPKAHEVLDCLIRGGARAMGAAETLGTIAPGRLADLTILDLDTLAFTPLNDIGRQLVHCENGSSVRLTMVAGAVVYDGERVTTVDEKALRAEARTIFAEKRAALAIAEREAADWAPAYRAMVLKAHARDIGFNRRLDPSRN